MLVDVRHNPFSMKYERINFNFRTPSDGSYRVENLWIVTVR